MTGKLLTFHDAVGLLQTGGVLLMGTDTLPGFHCRADLPESVERILTLKGRPAGKSLLVLAGSLEQAAGVTGSLDDDQVDFCERCWPGPFSLILPAGSGLASGVPSDAGTVAVRVPAVPSLCDVILAVGSPLVSTSANLSGRRPSGSLETAARTFADKVNGIWQPDEKNIDKQKGAGSIPSALIDVTVWPPVVLRAGPQNPPAAG